MEHLAVVAVVILVLALAYELEEHPARSWERADCAVRLAPAGVRPGARANEMACEDWPWLSPREPPGVNGRCAPDQPGADETSESLPIRLGSAERSRDGGPSQEAPS
ncbi:hypothetical protein RJ55_04363 [Drechmeria coniospora]|nr:hypothetical protein RJ55_04363 [Drechmeria coniospora]